MTHFSTVVKDTVVKGTGRRRWRLRLPVAVLAFGLAASALSGVGTGPASAAPEGPALRNSAHDLAKATRCFTGRDQAGSPVFLVPGTGGTGPDHYAGGLAVQLARAGITYCWVSTPDREYGDIQNNVEYVVAGIRRLAASTDRKVSVVGYSQGAVLARWAVRWWPDIRASVGKIVTLEGANQGTSASSLMCAATPCPPAVEQLRPDSKLIRKLNADPMPSGPVYTAIGSPTDDLVQSIETPRPYFIPGNRRGNILVQDVCPGRYIAHASAPFDAAVLAIAMRALTKPGHVRARDIDKRVCRQGFAPGVDAASTPARIAQLYADGFTRVITYPNKVTVEPALRAYAR